MSETTPTTAPAVPHIDWHALARAEAEAAAKALVEAFGDDRRAAIAALEAAEHEAYTAEGIAVLEQYRWARRASAFGRAHRSLLVAELREETRAGLAAESEAPRG